MGVLVGVGSLARFTGPLWGMQWILCFNIVKDDDILGTVALYRISIINIVNTVSIIIICKMHV